MSVTLWQKELVQDTWEWVEPVSEAAARIFYDRLFEINPQLWALFPAQEGQMEDQGRKLMQMITVRGLDRLDNTSPALEDLERQPDAYGLRDGNNASAGAVLRWTLVAGPGRGDLCPRAPRGLPCDQRSAQAS